MPPSVRPDATFAEIASAVTENINTELIKALADRDHGVVVVVRGRAGHIAGEEAEAWLRQHPLVVNPPTITVDPNPPPAERRPVGFRPPGG